MRRLVKSAGTLVMGTAAAQLISLAVLPLISRLYGAEAYGEFSTYVVWVGLIAILATLQFQHAIILPKLQKTAIAVLRTSIVCVDVSTMLVLGRSRRALVTPLSDAALTLCQSIPKFIFRYWLPSVCSSQESYDQAM